MKIGEIPVHSCIKTKLTELPQEDTGDDSELQLLCFSHCICMIDWCDEEYHVWPTNIILSSAEEKWL